MKKEIKSTTKETMTPYNKIEELEKEFDSILWKVLFKRLTPEVQEFIRARFSESISLAVKKREGEIIKKIEEARSDSAPFNRDQIQFANNLLEQKNRILDDILSSLTPKE